MTMTEEELQAYKEKAREQTPIKYRQPISEFVGRSVNGSEEDVDYVPGTHLRIWYNNLIEGYEMHHHPATEIIICVENGYSVFVENQLYTMQPGDIFFIPPNTLHRLPGGVEGTRFICLMDLSPLQQFRDFTVLDPVLMHPLFLTKSSGSALYREIHELMMQIVETYFSSPGMWELKIYSTLFEVYSTIGQDYYASKANFSTSYGPGRKANYEKFAALLHDIDEHYGEDITLEQAAESVGFSKYHFTRLFKEYTGTTFLDYLMNKRIQAAQKLLSTDESITSIAFRTGFNNLTSFNRSFKKYTGLSPSRYRLMNETYQGHLTLVPESIITAES